jgi:universal stress protein A
VSQTRRILHASDFSPASRAAFAKSIELAKTHRATLFVLHVLTVVLPYAGEGYIPPKIWDDIAEGQRRGAQRELDRLLARARRAGVRVKGLLVVGTPYETITRMARRQRADLLVLGTHGRTGLSKMLLGSVAERVLRTASCPVVTVRGA